MRVVCQQCAFVRLPHSAHCLDRVGRRDENDEPIENDEIAPCRYGRQSFIDHSAADEQRDDVDPADMDDDFVAESSTVNGNVQNEATEPKLAQIT